MITHWIMTLPISSIAYGLCAVGCAVWAVCRRVDSIPWSLSGLILSIAVLNAYTEKWPLFKRLRFEYVLPVLVVLFLLPYRSLCLRLIERTGLRARLIKEMYSYLIVVYAGLIATMMLSLVFSKDENPPLVLFVFIAFVCAIHVPMFAAGVSKVVAFVTRTGTVAKTNPGVSLRLLMTVTLVMGTPLILSLIQAVVRDDYRLFTVDAAMTAIIFSLFAISRWVARTISGE